MIRTGTSGASGDRAKSQVKKVAESIKLRIDLRLAFVNGGDDRRFEER